MKGTIIKDHDKWQIKYLDWSYDIPNKRNRSDTYRKILKEFIIELEPSDAKDAESFYKTEYCLENKKISFEIKELNNSKYGKLIKPSEDKTKIFNSTIINELHRKCIFCENKIELLEFTKVCDGCLDALKLLILEKRKIINLQN